MKYNHFNFKDWEEPKIIIPAYQFWSLKDIGINTGFFWTFLGLFCIDFSVHDIVKALCFKNMPS